MGEWKLSDSELFIMQHFWAQGAMKTDQLAPLVAAKGWKATTLLTFLTRLAAKGVLQVKKQGKANLYTPALSRGEYQSKTGRAFLDEMYAGSAKNFLAAMINAKGLSARDVEDLKAWLNNQEVEEDA